jgi:hypothetical protein
VLFNSHCPMWKDCKSVTKEEGKGGRRITKGNDASYSSESYCDWCATDTILPDEGWSG